jgi:hypothetical protein
MIVLSSIATRQEENSMTERQNPTGQQTGIEQRTGFAGQNDSNTKGELKSQAQGAGDQSAGAEQQAKDRATKTASALASEAGERVHSYLDQQVVAGADLVEGVSNAMRVAANELGRTSPMLASAARRAADSVQNVSRNFKNKNADELLSEARDMVRRKPALVFGAAAGLGFLAFRVLNAGRRLAPHNLTPLQASEDPIGGTQKFASTHQTGRLYSGTGRFGSTDQAGSTYGETGPEPSTQTGRDQGR